MQRGVVVIPKAGSTEHLQENFKGMFDWRLSNQQKVSTVFAHVPGLPVMLTCAGVLARWACIAGPALTCRERTPAAPT